jgi:type IV pilus assembly protein PilN
MDITVNLAEQPYIDSRPIIRALRIGMGIAVLLSLAVGIAAFFVHRNAQEVRGRSHALEASVDSLQAEEHAYRNMMRSSSVVEIAQQADELNQIVDAKAFSWTAVMQDLERVLPSRVQVTAIEPMRTKDGSTSLHLRVVGPHEKSVDLLRNLEASKRFLQPRIVGESLANNEGLGQKIVAVDASTMMEFDLMAEYNGSAQQTGTTVQQSDSPLKQARDPQAGLAATARHASANVSSHGARIGGAR